MSDVVPIGGSKARNKQSHNQMLVDRVKGISPQAGTPETDADPQNPNVQSGQGWTTRRAPHLERYVTIAPVVIEDWPDAHHVFLQVTNQRFCVTPHGCETKDEAEWTRDMLCIALDQIVRDQTTK